jgi:outer membrane lipoprotein carrier protein
MILLSFALLLCAAPDVSGDSVWQSLRARYLGLSSLSGSFEETICSSIEGTCQTFTGSFAVVLPDHYRIEVDEPESQLIVCDDSILWFYFPEENRAVREHQGRSIPLLAFLEPLLDSTAAAEVTRDSSGALTVELLVEDDLAALTDLKLRLDDDMRITRFEFEDGWGNHYTFTLTDQRWNPDIPWETFRFTPPAGTQVD